MYVCMCVCRIGQPHTDSIVYVCMYVCMYICVCVCRIVQPHPDSMVYVCMYVHMCVCAGSASHTLTPSWCMYVCTYMCVRRIGQPHPDSFMVAATPTPSLEDLMRRKSQPQQEPDTLTLFLPHHLPPPSSAAQQPSSSDHSTQV